MRRIHADTLSARRFAQPFLRRAVIVSVTRHVPLVALGLWLSACSSKDTVLQPDTAAGSGGTPAVGAMSSAATSAAGSGEDETSAAVSGRGSAGAAGSMSSGSAGAAPAGSSVSAAGASGKVATPAAAAGAGAGGESKATTAGASGGSAGVAGSGDAGSGGMAGPTDADCDMTGIWIADQQTVSEALSLPQTSNNWYYLEFKQTGTDVVVTKQFDCGIEVLGSATVIVNRATTEALLKLNEQTGRKATMMKNGATCTFKAERFWSIRGGDVMKFLPEGGKRNSMQTIKQAAAAVPLPTMQSTDGAVDTEKDGKLGVAFQVTGIATGTRNSVQRDWTEWFTESGYEIPASMNWTTDLKIRADFDNEESVLDATNPLLTSLSMPANAKHVLRLRFLGRDASDPRVGQVVKSSDVDTCFAIQDALAAGQL